MTNRFTGFSRQMPAFFRGLEKNNDRDWFGLRKEIFETQIKLPMVELVTGLNEGMRRISAEHVADVPAKAIYRIYRDTRFSKDKTPYKTHIGATFHHRTLSRHGGAGFYFEVSHRYVGIAGGVYMPGPEELAVIRTAIAADTKGFVKVVEHARMKKVFGALQGERLKRLPKAWQAEADGPVEGYLKMKQFFWWVELPAGLALEARLPAVLLRHFEAMSEGIGWFNRALLKGRKLGEEDAEAGRPAPMW